jgi:hypothetical protein
MKTSQFNWVRMGQENAGNSADECLPCARIEISAIFSIGTFFYRIAFPVTLNDLKNHIYDIYDRNV